MLIKDPTGVREAVLVLLDWSLANPVSFQSGLACFGLVKANISRHSKVALKGTNRN